MSLADVYDVEGSIAGVETLLSEEVQAVHEMGATIFSERFSTSIRTFVTGDLAQNVNFDVEITDLPTSVSRILAIQVIADAVRVRMATVSVRDPILLLETPIWMWDTTNDAMMPVRIENGGTPADVNLLLPSLATQISLPQMLAGTAQIQRVPELAFRGDTTGFGAGTVELTLILYSARAQLGGVSSHGLPVPSW